MEDKTNNQPTKVANKGEFTKLLEETTKHILNVGNTGIKQKLDNLKKRINEFLVPKDTEVIYKSLGSNQGILFLKDNPLSVNILRDILTSNYLEYLDCPENLSDEDLQKSLDTILEDHIRDDEEDLEYTNINIKIDCGAESQMSNGSIEDLVAELEPILKNWGFELDGYGTDTFDSLTRDVFFNKIYK